VYPSAPSAPSLLPVLLSATACEALRACPYRFYTLYALHGREVDELDEDLGPRDYGNWLHAVLHAFHLERGGVASVDEDTRNLHRHALALRDAHALDAADFIPFAASFAAFVPRYVAWLQARDRDGARWRVGEQRFKMALPDSIGIELEGIIDRIDDAPGGALDLIDYKTGSASKLEDKVRTPLEDTQLAFYAALMREQSDAPLRAIYLALDTSSGVRPIEHPDVERSAARLVSGLTLALRRV
jgi:ATP-dependent helicase/nuclease subunit B